MNDQEKESIYKSWAEEDKYAEIMTEEEYQEYLKNNPNNDNEVN